MSTVKLTIKELRTKLEALEHQARELDDQSEKVGWEIGEVEYEIDTREKAAQRKIQTKKGTE